MWGFYSNVKAYKKKTAETRRKLLLPRLDWFIYFVARCLESAAVSLPGQQLSCTALPCLAEAHLLLHEVSIAYQVSRKTQATLAGGSSRRRQEEIGCSNFCAHSSSEMFRKTKDRLWASSSPTSIRTACRLEHLARPYYQQRRWRTKVSRGKGTH